MSPAALAPLCSSPLDEAGISFLFIPQQMRQVVFDEMGVERLPLLKAA